VSRILFLITALVQQKNITFKNLDGTLIEKDSGVFWLQTSSFDSKSIAMTITGDSPLGLQKAAEAFATTSVFDRLSGRNGNCG
jgi:hypothetical protein